MLTEIYIEALPVNEELPDQVWELWNSRQVDDQLVCIAWLMIALAPASQGATIQ